jgi:hypothetical protein
MVVIVLILTLGQPVSSSLADIALAGIVWSATTKRRIAAVTEAGLVGGSAWGAGGREK